MRYPVVFAGHNIATLEYLARRQDIDLVCCFFHTRSGDPSSFVTLCTVYGLPCRIVSNNEEMLSTLEKCGEVILGISSGYEILSESVYGRPQRGFVNVHSSYLPSYKGANPFYHQLLNNEKEGGVSIHQVTEDVDGGRIFCREKYPIYFRDDVSVLIKRANNLGAQLMDTNLAGILEGAIKGIRNTGGSYYPSVRARQSIDLNMSPLQIYNLVRSQTIYGGCYLEFEDEVVCVRGALIGDKRVGMRKSDGGIVVKVSDERYLILELSQDVE